MEHLLPNGAPSGHLTDDQVEQFRRGQAAAHELLAMDDHLTGCPECRARVVDDHAARAFVLWAEGLDRDGQENERALPATVAPAPSRRSPAKWIGFLAAAAAAVLGYFGWMALRPKPEQPPTIASTQHFRVEIRDAGSRIAIRDDGAVIAPASLGEADRALIASALNTGRLPLAPPTPELAMERGVLRGAAPGATLALLAPLGTVTLSDRPEFRWEALNGATSYRVQVFDSDFREVATSGNVTAPNWQPSRPLERGKLYQWQISATVGGNVVRAPAPPAPEARFQIASRETAEKIESAKSSHLLAALLCAQAGLRDDARREAEALRAENPDSDVVRKLIASLQ